MKIKDIPDEGFADTEDEYILSDFSIFLMLEAVKKLIKN
jgi:hypothetical protein